MTAKEFMETRKRLGFTQHQLGLLIGVPQQRIHEIERRPSGPTVWQAWTIRLLERIGVTAEMVGSIKTMENLK